MRRFNLNEPDLVDDGDAADGYHTAHDRFGKRIGAQKTGATLYLIRPGQSICPYHYEYPEEEWLLVLDGHPTLRHPHGADELREGDIVVFPEGPEALTR